MKRLNPTRRAFVKTLSVLPFAGALPSSMLAAPARVKALRPICLFSKHLQWMSYRQLAETAAEIGFDGIDLTVRPGGHVDPSKVEIQLTEAVVEGRKAGLPVDTITTNITDADDPQSEPIVKACSILGIKHYRMGAIRYDESIPPEVFLEQQRVRFEKLAALNAKYQVLGSYQNHAGVQLGSPVWDLWELLKTAYPAHLGCQYDIRHAVVEGGRSWPLGLKLLRNYIKTTVIKDFRWEETAEGWRIRNTPLGEGMVDFPAYFSLIKKYDIAGPVSLHFEYPLPTADIGFAARKRETMAVMRKDLETLRGYMRDAAF